ncbi:uncharacterized protein LOC132904720 [Bombus pascuorum]|uniref:uncharacterized protein LOC132904720 n=1 Tax=Bombus pascuorum TaxID=65598 RepID=UPI00298E67EC|nr:uncharacterized protein LOC132904720 [Bombus pascuorum]
MICNDESERMAIAYDCAIMLEYEQMCGRTPSKFYHDLKILATPLTPDDFILMFWEKKLPVFVQDVLAAVQDRNVEKRIQIADFIYESDPESEQVVMVNAEQTTAVTDQPAQKVEASNPFAVAIDDMSEQIAQLETKMRGLSLYRTRPARRRIRSHRKSNLRNRLLQLGLCYYHATYQQHAKKCRFPCAWSTENKTRRTKSQIIPRYMTMNI